ncbi:MAG: hypothetical protein JSV85_04210 [Candidatus Bathyarchaeota archaeon]|nr:MAG: hypothetical protein JSV85_04210 [Candidatus Bathyarchaeota archaeon]
MSGIVDKDREMLERMPKDRLFDLFFLHIRNLWRVDGLYFLGIEEKFNTDAAMEIDANCWQLMGKLEAKALKKVLKIKGNDISSLIYALRNTSWALDQRDKEVEVTATKCVYRVTECRTQLTRMRKGLGEFPCRKVRFNYLRSFAEEMNPLLEVKCRICPPSEHPTSVWCEWEFKLKKTK